MKLNVKPEPIRTHGGVVAQRINPEQQLRRSVMSCLLWEREFYEDGQDIAARIIETADKLPLDKVAAIAIEAREVAHLRHVPLLLVRAMARRGGGAIIGDTLARVIQRADEITEFLSIYWKDGRQPLSKQVQRGLAQAFLKFDEYAFAKYDRDGAVKLRDALFLCHAKPETPEQERLFKAIVDRTLTPPDTWEVALSGGADKRATFERLLHEQKLGYLALLRNLRNMADAGVDRGLMRDTILARKGAHRVLPFRFVAAARACPQMESALDQALVATIAEMPRLTGRTAVLVDVSGSMGVALSAKSDMTRMDAAAALASVINADDLRVFSFSSRLVEVPPRRGMAGVDVIIRSQGHGSTEMAGAVDWVNRNVGHNRLIVITDEQATGWQRVPDPVAARAYMVNVASARNGVGYGKYIHIDGFSENVIRFIVESER
jgi:60 kDa SS-A/Ro ribonucleoprotein